MKKLLVLAPLLLSACGDDEIRVYKIARSAEATSAAVPAHSSSPSMPTPAQQRSAGSSVVRWTLPQGWSELPAKGMRKATLRAPSGVEMSVIALAGMAGGVLENVNRWRRQIGLVNPIAQEALDKNAQTVKSSLGAVLVVDYSHKEQRLLAAILPYGGQAWFFKITGEPVAVGKAKPAFLELLKGLHN
jgi:hypothetical protein